MKKIEWTPINLEAEQALLGALLINNSSFQTIAGLVAEEDFGEPVHAYLFGIMSGLLTAGKLVDVKIVSGLVDNAELMPQVTVKKYLARLAAEATTIVNAPDYARHVHELADRRRIAAVGHALAPREDMDAASMAAEAIDALDGVVSQQASQGRVTTMQQAVIQAIDATANAYARNGEVMGVPFTLRDLDRKTGGMSGGDLVVVAGRPGMGKSAMLLTMLRRQAERGLKIFISSLEMSAMALTQRMISDVIFDWDCDRLPYFNLRSGQFHEKLFDQVRRAGDHLTGLPILTDDRAGIPLSYIAARARQLKRRQGLDLVAIDHLDLIRASQRYAGNRTYEISEITAGAKALAKELDIPVVLLSQLSREVEKRDDKRPTLSDLRSSGSIEQDADTVIFLYRPAYYLQNAEPKTATPEYEKWTNDMEAAQNKLLAIIAKQRMGPSGIVELFCDVANNAVRDMDSRR